MNLEDMTDDQLRNMCEKAMAFDPTYTSKLCKLLAAEVKRRLDAVASEPLRVRVEVLR